MEIDLRKYNMKKVLIILIIAIALSTVGTTSNKSPDGLIAWFRLDGTAEDSSGRNNHGIIRFAEPAAGIRGKAGTAFFFPAEKKAYIYNMSDSGFPQGDLPRTMSAWIKTDKEAPGGFVIADYGRMGTNTNSSLWYTDSRLVMSFGNYRVSGTTDLNDSKWHFAAAAWDGENVNLYIDGKLEVSEAPAKKPYTMYSGSFTIGVTNNKQKNNFDGSIDDVRVYNRSLSAEEIRDLFENPL